MQDHEFVDDAGTEYEYDEISKDECMWAMLCHLSTFCGFIPFGNLVGPLVVWLIKKDEYPLVDDQGKEAINFQINMTIYFVISFVLVFVVIGIPLLIGLGVFDLVVTIIAAIKAYSGEYHRYPLTIRFLN